MPAVMLREMKRCIIVRAVSVGAAHLWPSSRPRGGNTVSASSSTVAVDDDASAPWRSRESAAIENGGRKEDSSTTPAALARGKLFVQLPQTSA